MSEKDIAELIGIIDRIEELVEWHADLDADIEDPSPEDSHAHCNGLVLKVLKNARRILEKPRDHELTALWKCGLLPSHHDTLEKASQGVANIIRELRQQLHEPPANVQEKVLEMLGVYKALESKDNEIQRLKEKLDWQNMPNRREPVRGGWEFYINEEWTGVRDAALDDDCGFQATLMKVRFDPDDERVRVRRVLDDDAILNELQEAKALIEKLQLFKNGF